MIIKGCVQWNLVYGWKDFSSQAGLEPGTTRSVGTVKSG